MVCLLRNTSDSAQKFTSFAFPNIDDSHCITEIQLTWENFMFVSKLTSIPTHLMQSKGSKKLW